MTAAAVRLMAGAPARNTARLVIVSEHNHVLLVRYQEGGRSFWAAPGSGLLDGETFDAAAERAVVTEIGLSGASLEPLWESVGETRRRGRRLRQVERFYLCRTRREDVARSPRVAEVLEADGALEWRWWAAEELERGDETVLPEDLAARLRAMTTPPARAESAHFSVRDGLARLPGPAGERFAVLFEHGSLSVELYAPRGTDPQQPHTRDEVYVVAQGRGIFWDGESRRPVGPGDFLFVAAGRPHRFEDFSDDLAVWVLFYGPEGGER